MNINDFEELLGAEPRSQAPELMAAKTESLQHAAAMRDALAFEDKLEQAMHLPVAGDLAEQVLAHVRAEDSTAVAAGSSQARPWYQWVAAAATVTLVVAGGLFTTTHDANAAPLRAAFSEHITHEAYATKPDRETVSEAKVREAFASYGAEWHPAEGTRVTYLSNCQMGDKRGLHLVISNDDGERTTVLYLPEEKLRKSSHFEVEAMAAKMLNTEDGGVAALFAHDGQQLNELPGQLLAMN